MPAHRAKAARPCAQTCVSGQAIVASDDAVDDPTLPERAGIGDERLPQASWHRAQSGRCASLQVSPDITQNGRAHWAEAELAHLSEEPARAA